MTSNYELHKESADQVESARERLAAARESLSGTEQDYEKAVQNYERVLEESKKELTPELVAEAAAEFKSVLKGKLFEAVSGDRFAEVMEITKDLVALEKNYGTDSGENEKGKAGTMPEGLRSGIELFLNTNGLENPNDRIHYMNRGSRLFRSGLSEEDVIASLSDELKKSLSARKAPAPWTGWEAGK